MNSSLIELLGSSLPPSAGDTPLFANTCAVSQTGDIAMLCNDGTIKYSSIRTSSNALVLDVMGLYAEDILQFTTVEFDEEGKSLLVWSPARVGIIELPHSMLDNDAHNGDVRCIFTNLLTVDDDVDERSSYPIAKAAFHSLCPHCVVVLHQKEVLRVIDIRTMDVQTISTSSSRSFASFTFGPSIDWMKFTIVLLTTSGDVYVVCPVIPAGTVLSLSAVDDLWSWADQVEDENDREDRDVASYLSTLQGYLTELFGPRPTLNPSGSNDNAFVRAGDNQGPQFGAELYRPSGYTHSQGLSNYVPMVCGPLRIQKPVSDSEGPENEENAYAEGKSSGNGRPARRIANDICAPGVQRGFAAGLNQPSAAPVLAVSYSTGEVELLVLDFADQAAEEAGEYSASSRTRSASVRSGGSYAGPSWRSIDLSRAHLTCSAPGLVVAETIAVQGMQGDGERDRATGAGWRLQADPALSHGLHVTSVGACESYLLSIVWMEKAVEADQNDARSVSSADLRAEENERDAAPNPLVYPTKVLPVFVLPPQADAPEQSSRGSQESKAGGHKGANKGTSSFGAQLSGAVVLQDAMLGHVAIFRTTSGLASAVNLTVHTKLCELQESLQGHAGAADLLQMKDELEKATRAEHMRWRRSQQCIQKVAEGLRDMPQLDAATAAALTTQSSSQNKKVLLEAAQKLERDVLVPLNELAQTTLFSYEMLQETYRSQVELLEGRDSAESNNTRSGASTEPPTLSSGIKKIVSNLNSEHDALTERVRRIQEKFAAQREAAERHLAFAVSQRAKMSKAEGVYKRQLEDWSKVVSQMNEQVAALRALSCTSTLPGPNTSSAVPSTPQSPRAQPPLHSVLSTTNSVQSSGVKSQYFRSPVAAKVPLSMQSVSATPSSAANSTPSKQAGTGVTFSTPQTAGAFKTAGGALYRPYSTPAAAATPTSSIRGSSALPVSTPGTAGTATGMSRQYHTRHPPMATPSPNFYSNYKNARTPGSVMSGSTGNAASAADATARSGYSTSQFGSPAPRSPVSGASGAGACAPVVQLSEEDQQACTQLLISQTELLESAQQELSELEAKLKSLKQAQTNF